MPSYPNNVLTVHEKYQIPAIVGTINLDRRINQGDEIVPENLEHAQNTAVALRGLLHVGDYPELNEDVVRGAELRAKAIENIHAALEYAPADLVQVLHNINTNVAGLRDEVMGLRNEVKIGKAETNNALARIQNRFISPDHLLPLQKVVVGSGLQRGEAVAAPAYIDALRAYAAANPNPEIGTTPPFFNGDVDVLQVADILKLICFYNDNMGIAPADGLPEQKRAVCSYLTSF